MKISEDLRRYSNGSIKKAIMTILINPCFHCVCLYRLSSFMYHIHFTILAKVIWYINRLLFYVDIDFRSEIAAGFKIVHGLGIVIGQEVHAGKNLTVYQHVTLGGSMGKRMNIGDFETGQPYLENNITIYTGASIFGPVHIKDNEIVKAGSIVTVKTRGN